MKKIVLGSSSPFRKKLLKKLEIEFDCYSPDIDESHQEGESPEKLVQRLSCSKATAVAKQYPKALVIGSDQVALHNNKILGKPGSHENAIRQLSSFSAQTVHFLTGLCLHNSLTGQQQYYLDITLVRFRKLNTQDIQNYLLREKPYQCAGSFKSEGLGVALFESIESKDPNALIGLPVIKLVEMLGNEGLNVLS